MLRDNMTRNIVRYDEGITEALKVVTGARHRLGDSCEEDFSALEQVIVTSGADMETQLQTTNRVVFSNNQLQALKRAKTVSSLRNS